MRPPQQPRLPLFREPARLASGPPPVPCRPWEYPALPPPFANARRPPRCPAPSAAPGKR